MEGVPALRGYSCDVIATLSSTTRKRSSTTPGNKTGMMCFNRPPRISVASMNAENGLITSLEVTPGNAYDGHHYCSPVDHDLGQNLAIETYTADRGYDDGNNHYYLQHLQLHSAIRMINMRTHKKDKNKQPWIDLSATPVYQQGLKQRYKIERKVR